MLRFVLFIVLLFGMIFSLPHFLRVLGLILTSLFLRLVLLSLLLILLRLMIVLLIVFLLPLKIPLLIIFLPLFAVLINRLYERCNLT